MTVKFNIVNRLGMYKMYLFLVLPIAMLFGNLLILSQKFKDVRHKEPMVMSLDYWEQSGNALANLYNLQCWASSVGIDKVVEPDVVTGSGSIFQFSIGGYGTFQDYYNIDHWNMRSLEHDNGFLVSRKLFFWFSYKEIVYVQILFPTVKCKSVEEVPSLHLFILYYFKISTICVPFNVSDTDLKERIFGKDIKSIPKVSVIFEQWRGISLSRTFRLRLLGTKCGAGYSYLRTKEFRAPISTVVISRRIVQYYESFLRDFLQAKGYIAVMIRTEKLYQVFNSRNLENVCLQEIISDYKKAVIATQTWNSIVFSDLSDHGSKSLNTANKLNVFMKRIVTSIKPVYSPYTIDMILEIISGSRDSLLISLIQSTIAANAKSLILVGGGSFQMMTLNNYMEISGSTKNYFFRNNNCRLIPNFNNPSIV